MKTIHSEIKNRTYFNLNKNFNSKKKINTSIQQTMALTLKSGIKERSDKTSF